MVSSSLSCPSILRQCTARLAYIVLWCVIFAGFSLKYTTSVHAIAKTWTGLGADNNWSTSDNWSPVGQPATSDTVTFNGTGTKDATIDALANASVSTFAVSVGYTGTITLARSFTMTGTYTQAAGNFTASNQILAINSTYSMSAGTFTASSTTTTFSGAFTVSGGTFTHNSGTVVFAGGAVTLSCGGTVFNLVSFAGQSGIKTVNSNCTLPLGLDPTVPNGILLHGTLSGTGTFTQTTGQLNMQSTSGFSGFTGLTGTSNSIRLNGNTINASAYTLFSVPNGFTINSSGTFTAPSVTMSVGVTFDINPGTFIHNNGTVNIYGSAGSVNCNSQTLHLVTFTGQTGTKTVNANCSLPLGLDPVVPNSITLNGTLSGSGTLTQTTGTLTLNSGAAMTGFSGLTGTSNILNVNGATVDFSTYTTFTTTGTTSVGNGSVTFPNGASIAGTLSVTGGTMNMTTGSITVGGGLTLSTGTLNAPTGTLNVGGAITFTSSGTFVHNSGTVNLNGGTVSHACNSATFNRVTFSITAAQTIGAACTFPLGASPTIPFGLSVSGTLTGTGTFTISSGTLTLNTGGSLSGFSQLSTVSYTNAGATANFSGYSSFTVSDTVSVSSGTLTLPSGTVISNAFTLSGGTLATTTGSITIGGTVTITTGTMNAPTGTLSVGGNFAHTSGTFTHNSGTVSLTGGTQIISGTATTFHNLSKVLSSATAQTLTFPSGSLNTQTVLGTLTLNGYDTSNRLLLRSSSGGTQWRTDAQSTRSLLYLDVKDGNNINATPMQVGGTGSLDSTNNTSWNFGSLTPNVPSSLGPSEVISGGYTTSLNPLFSFSLTDPNPLDTIKYTINISTHSDFSSPIVDFTSTFFSQGTSSFTVGQSVSGGTYTAGSSGQTLSSGDYYWRVSATDVNGLSSAATSANGGALAFRIDSVPPDAFTPTLDVSSPTTNTRPTVSFSTTDDVAIDHYTVRQVSGSPSTQTSPYQMPILSVGTHTIIVRAYDTSLNYTEGSVSVTVIDPTPTPSPTPSATPTSTSSSSSSSSSDTPAAAGSNCNPGWSSCTSVSLDSLGAAIQTPNGGLSSVYIGTEATHMDLTVLLQEYGWQVIGESSFPTNPPWAQGLNTPGILTKLDIRSSFNGFDVLVMDSPLRISLPYNATLLGDIPVSSLRLARYIQSTQRWNVIDRNTIVDTQTGIVSNTTLYPGFYTVVYASQVEMVPDSQSGTTDVIATPSASLSTPEPTPAAQDTPEQRQAVIDMVQSETNRSKKVLGIITEIASYTAEVIVKGVEVAKPAAMVTPVVVSVATVGLAVGGAAVQSGSSFRPDYLIKILQSLGLMRRGKPQGLIYETDTSKPVPFAMVTFTKSDQQIMETTVSDVHGVYGGVKLSPGSYTLSVVHQDFNFPTKARQWGIGSTTDFYTGEPFSVTSEATEQLFSIPVDPRTETPVRLPLRTLVVLAFNQLLSHQQQVQVSLTIFTIICTLISPSMHNLAMAALYGALLVRGKLNSKRKPLLCGTILDNSGKPLENVIVKVVSSGTNQLQSVTQSSVSGYFSAFVRPGKYQISVIKNGYVWEKYAASMGLEEVLLDHPTVYEIEMKPISEFLLN